MTETRIAEREARLARLLEVLEQDVRVEAAWHFGAFARGAADAWSDLDIWISVRDDRFEEFLGDREAIAGSVDPPLCMVEAPQNAPAGGGYFQSIHDSPSGPHIVDWYIQPTSIAGLPSRDAVLISPRDEDRSKAMAFQMEPIPSELRVHNTATVFWMMVLVQAKYVAREPSGGSLAFLGFLDSLLANVRSSCRRLPFSGLRSGPVARDPRLALLRQRVEEMADLCPLSGILPQRVDAFLATVDAALEEHRP